MVGASLISVEQKRSDTIRQSVLLVAALLVCLTLLFTLPFDFVPHHYRGTAGLVLDVSHFYIFALYSIFLALLIPFFYSSWQRLSILTLSGAILAGAFEIIQHGLPERSASFTDWQNGIFGCIAGALFVALLKNHQKTFYWALFFTACGALNLLMFLPAYKDYEAYKWRIAAMPMLSDFENPKDMHWWRKRSPKQSDWVETKLSTEWSSKGTYSLQVKLHANTWRALFFDAGFLSWRGYESLAFDISNPEEAFTLGVRIDDEQTEKAFSDRFNTRLFIPSGVSKHSIKLNDIENGPVHRLLNLDHIRWMMLFTGSKDKERNFFIDNLRLE